jgi:hypothetical protein
VDHIGTGLLVGSQTTNRLLSTQYGIYGIVLVVLGLAARDEHLSGRDVCGGANHMALACDLSEGT